MDKFKFYSLGLVFLVVTELLIAIIFSLYLDPPMGDITRLSGYSENDFGWNAAQKVFDKQAKPLQDVYDHYVDVFVVGDSFSFGGVLQMMNYPWQSYFTANTGLTVSTLSHYTTKTKPPSYDRTYIPNIVNSETFKKTPPKVFILQVVERQLNMLPKISGDCRVHNEINTSLNLVLKKIPEMNRTNNIFRDRQRPPFTKRFPYVVKYIETFYSNSGGTGAFVFDLITDKLFSSKSSDKLLVYGGDVEKKNWDDNLVENIKCRLINFQNLVQANGKTLFITMIAPDKLTIYSRYLKDSSFAKYSPIARFSSEPSLHLPRLDLALQSALDEGVVDLYLPNDTHWASRGQEIAAQALQKYLTEFSED